MSDALKIFVTFELSPFNAGGIGRVIHNILVTMTPSERQTSIVLAVDFDCDRVAFESRFPGARLIAVNTTSASALTESDLLPPRQAYESFPWLWKSICILRVLKSLAVDADIAYVEFPDWGGFGFATLQEKVIHGFLSDATLAVRLHTSHAVLCAEEGYPYSLSDRFLSDIERKCCRDCDLLIGQTEPASAYMKRLYGFRDDEWDPRFILHPPPVLLDYSNQPTRSIVPDAETAIIFGSKLQRIKNPATFIRGCVGFLRTSREFRGTVRLLAHDFDGFYADQIKALVPTDLSSRITFSPGAPDRNESIAQGISVLSSDFESYCLAAYEASLLGGIVVLNNSNPAFGNNTAWIDGVNCIKYDGSALSLVAALRRAATLCAPLDIVRIPTTPAPWRHARPGIRSSPIESPLVSIVIPHHNLQDFLLDAIESCLVQDYPNLEIIVVDDCSSEIKSEKVLALLELSCIENLTICRLPTNVGLSAARNIGIAESKGKYIVTLDADDMINKEFVKWGVGCLERNATIDIVVPNARCFVEDPTTAVSTPFASSGYYAFLGEAFCSGFSVNSFGTSCAMFRSDLFYEIEYDETMEALEDWTLYINAVNANKRCAVMNQAAFYYRHRANSLSAGFNDPKWFEVCAAKVKRMASRTPPRLPIQFLALRGPESSGPHHQGTTPGPTYAELEALRKEAAEARTDAAYISGHLQARSAMLGALIGIYRAEFNVNNEATVRELIKIFGFFDPSWYRANYPELIGTDDKLFEHFITVGLIEQRMPNSHFNPEVYLARYPDVRASGMPAVVHYLLYGAGEGRTF